jgi:Flp pilus assembly protein TadD
VIFRWLVASLFLLSVPVLWAQDSARLLNEAEAALMEGRMEKAVLLNPKHAESHYLLGKAYSKQGKVTQAVTQLEHAIALNPDQDGAYQELARIYLKEGRKEQAESLLTTLNDRKQKRKAQFETKVSGASSQPWL